jgi:hypothetical protein
MTGFQRGSSLIPIQTAFVTALSNDTTLSTLINGVYDKRPGPEVALPYITIGAPQESPWDCFGTLGQIVKFQVSVWWRIADAKSSLGVKTIMAAVNNVLDDQVLDVEGYDSSIKIRNMMSTDMPDPDNKHWHGIMQFTIWVTQCPES